MGDARRGNSGVDEAASRLDFEDPRVRAAMRILGITHDDITPKATTGINLSSGKSALSETAQQKRLQFLESKRQELLEELAHTVEAIEEEHAEQILHPDPMSAARSTGRSVVSMHEQGADKMVRLRVKKEADLQKILDDQEAKIQKLEEAEQRKEDNQKRLQAVEKEKKLALGEKIEAKRLKHAKKDENLMKGWKQRREGAKELMSKLHVSFDKVQQHLKEKNEHLQQVAEEHDQKRHEVQRRKNEMALAAQEELVRLYQEKEDIISQRLEEKRSKQASHAKDEEDKYLEKMEALQAMIEKRQADKEAAFRKTADQLAKAREQVSSAFQEKAAAIGESIEKRFAKRDVIITATRKERFQKRKALMDKLSTMSSDDGHSKTQHLEEERRRHAEQRGIMGELVAQNQQRLQRANGFAREQMLAKISISKAKMDGMKEQQEQLRNERALLLKESMVEKASLQESMRTMKRTPRVVTPPLAAEAAK